MPGTRKLGRTTDHRTAMLRAMVTFLLENGKIETTVTRAKEVRSLAEKMITIAKEKHLRMRLLLDGNAETADISMKEMRLRRSARYARIRGLTSRESARITKILLH